MTMSLLSAKTRLIASCSFQLQHTAMEELSALTSCGDVDISTPFIRTCLPKVVERLGEVCSQQPTSEVQLNVCKECIAYFELVLSLVPDDKSTKMIFLNQNETQKKNYLPLQHRLLADTPFHIKP